MIPAPTIAAAAVVRPPGSGPTYVDDLLARLDRAGRRPVLRSRDRDVTGDELRRSYLPLRPGPRAPRHRARRPGGAVRPERPGRPRRALRRRRPRRGDDLPARSAMREHPVRAARRDRRPAAGRVPSTAHLVPADNVTPVATVGADRCGAARLDWLADVQSDVPMPGRAHPDDVATIVSSGGSTGVPKGSWRTFTGYAAMVAVPSPADRRQLVNGELAHLSHGPRRPDPARRRHRRPRRVVRPGRDAGRDRAPTAITDLLLVEPQLADLVDHPDVDRGVTSRRCAPCCTSAHRHRRRCASGPGPRLGPVDRPHVRGQRDRPGQRADAGRARPGPPRVVQLRRAHPSRRRRTRFRARRRHARRGAAKPGIIEVRSPAVAMGYRNRSAEDAGGVPHRRLVPHRRPRPTGQRRPPARPRPRHRRRSRSTA